MEQQIITFLLNAGKFDEAIKFAFELKKLEIKKDEVVEIRKLEIKKDEVIELRKLEYEHQFDKEEYAASVSKPKIPHPKTPEPEPEPETESEDEEIVVSDTESETVHCFYPVTYSGKQKQLTVDQDHFDGLSVKDKRVMWQKCQ